MPGMAEEDSEDEDDPLPSKIAEAEEKRCASPHQPHLRAWTASAEASARLADPLCAMA